MHHTCNSLLGLCSALHYADSLLFKICNESLMIHTSRGEIRIKPLVSA